MIGWLEPVVPHLKVLHIAMLGLWCAGLFALPLMLARHLWTKWRKGYAPA